MWVVGLILGLTLGAVFESFEAAVALGIGFALVAQSMWNKKKRGDAPPQPKSRPASARMSEAEWDEWAGAERGSGQQPQASAQAQAPGDPLSALRRQVAMLEQRVRVLEHKLASGQASGAGVPDAALADEAPPGALTGEMPSALPTAMGAGPASSLEPLPIAPVASIPPIPPVVPAAAVAAAEAMPGATARAIPAPTPKPATAAKPPAAPVVRPPPPPPVPLRDRLPAPIANLIFGGNMLVKLGVLILFLGLAFLLRYTAERVTVPLELRYAGVALVGAALLALGWFLRGRRRDYALVLQGAGVAVFYLTTLAAMKLHPLLPVGIGFAFLCLVAVLSAALAVLQNAPVLAVVAALGGFAAPVLASTGSNRPIGLFSYLLVLDLGIALIAWFKAWRLLNLIGFVGTFALASGWAQRYYTPEQYGVAQTFLLVFFLLFTAIGLLFARRTLHDAPADADSTPLSTRAVQTLRRVGRVDSALVFGVPMAAFGLQYLLMQPWEYGAAFAALGFGIFYLLLGRIVFSTQPRGLALLAEAYAIVGVIFGTLAIPLGLEGQWTGAAWAVEAAGMYWLGVRQSRPYARGFALLVLAGAVFKLMQATDIVGLPGAPLLAGSVIGPLLVALGSLAIWWQQRRAGLDRPAAPSLQWEMLASHALPWLAMGALTLLPWQFLTPPWAAAATAVLGLAAWGAAQRWQLGGSFAASGHGLQALGVGSFITTLHGGTAGKAFANGWQGTLPALVIAACLLGVAVLGMRQVLRAADERGAPPDWRWPQVVTVLAGVALLHLAMLFQISLVQAALIWPLTATVLLWVGLRLQHGPLAWMAGVLHAVSAGIHLVEQDSRWSRADAPADFANLGFWVPVVLGACALLGGDWLRREAARPRTQPADRFGRFGLSACAHPAVQWLPVIWGLGWWLVGWLGESAAVLDRRAWGAYVVAAWVAVVLLTSVGTTVLAARRDWRQLGLATLGTLPLWVLMSLGLLVAPLLGWRMPHLDYVPSSALGWLAWPLAAAWHLRLLRAQQRWTTPARLAALHVTGFWFFLLLAAREAQWQLASLGEPGSSWRWLGWVLVPVVALWLLRLPALRRRWPIAAFEHAYLRTAATPVALYLLAWAWLGNVMSPGNAAPLPYVPLLNPLELAQWLVLVALIAWWRAAPRDRIDAGLDRPLQAVAGLTAWALLTGLVLRACHHYAGVPWDFGALYASRLTQAALSITWALCGVATMVLGNRRAWRPLWLAGAVLLGVVVAKLFFVELADRGGLFRIVSFIGVGALLLLVGYFAPVPPARRGGEPEGKGAAGEGAGAGDGRVQEAAS